MSSAFILKLLTFVDISNIVININEMTRLLTIYLLQCVFSFKLIIGLLGLLTGSSNASRYNKSKVNNYESNNAYC